MGKINRLSFFIILRVAEAIILFWLKYNNAYTEKNFKILIITFVPVTLLVLVANFSKFKKFDKYKPLLDWGFFFLLLFLVFVESCLLFAGPKGYLGYGTAQWLIAGVEIILGICLRFIKKLDLL